MTLEKAPSSWQLLKEYATVSPDKVVYIDYSENKSITAIQLVKEVKKFASQLAIAGISEGDRCLIMIRQNFDFPIAFFACSYLGAIPVPLNVPKRNKELEKWERIAEDTKAACVITDISKVFHLQKITKDSEAFSEMPILFREEKKDDLPIAKEGHSDIAFLQYTSGSTGMPKGVIVGNSCVTANMEAMRQHLDMSDKSVIGMWLPYYHDMGLISGFLLSVYAKAQLVFMKPLDFMMSPIKWAEMICRYGVTHSPGPNFAFEMLAGKLEKEYENNGNRKNYSLSSMRCAFCGSEPVNLKTVLRFIKIAVKFDMNPIAMRAGYGLAENSLIAGGYRVKDLEDKDSWLCVSRKKLAENIIEITDSGYVSDFDEFSNDDDTDGVYFVGSGHDVPNHQMTVRDHDGNVIHEDYKIGTIYISGPSVALGYWEKENLTREVFQIENGYRTFNTGDIGFWGGNHEIFITGRQKEMLIINGKNYYPSDLEDIIYGLDDAFEKNGCACFSFVANDKEHLGLVAEISRMATKTPKYEEWAKEIRLAVLKNCGLKIDMIIFLKPRSIPRTTSGKLQRTYLKKCCETGKWHGLLFSSNADRTRTISKPNTLTECRVFMKEILKENSGVELVPEEYGIPFAELGVTSVMCTAMSADIEVAIDVNIQPQIFYTYNTVNSVAEYIMEEISQNEKISQKDMSDEELMKQLELEIGGV